MNRIITLLSNLFKSKRNNASYELIQMEYLEELMTLNDEEIAREYIKLRVIQEFTEKLKSRIGLYLIDQAQAENRSNWLIGKDKISVLNKKTYNYSNDNYWNKLNEELFQTKSRMKEHELSLKKLNEENSETLQNIVKDGILYTLQKPEIIETQYLRFDVKKSIQ